MRKYPGGRVGRLPDRPARRRHRPDRFLQRPNSSSRSKPRDEWPTVKSADRLATLVRRDAPPHQGRTDRGDERRAEPRHRRRRLELLAEHPRQRHGVALGRQGRQLGQDHRARPRRTRRRWPTRSRPSWTAFTGIKNVGVFRIKGQPNLEIPVDPQKCQRWGVSVADVEDVVQIAVGGKAVHADDRRREDASTSPSAGPKHLRSSEQAILNIPVDVTNNQVTAGTANVAADAGHRRRQPGSSKVGTSVAMPAYHRQPVRRHVQQHLRHARGAGWATW